MPRTTYGLLGAIRSHTISSPSVETTLTTGRPLACNLCHLDRTLAWSAAMLERDFAQPRVDGLPTTCTDDDVGQGVEGCVPASAEWLLAGDAGQRALMAWHVGRGGQRTPDWADAVLRWVAESDPYPAVRLVADRARRELAGTPVGDPPAWVESVCARRDERDVRLAE